MTITLYHSSSLPSTNTQKTIVAFLHEHLGAYGDSADDINKAFEYALGKNHTPGGLIITATDQNVLLGAVVLNKTGMHGYIPENILVYIATHKDARGKGIGKLLMETALQNTSGDIALHVEPHNPAKKLYEHFGFTNKYLEMRLKK